jgi:hypothetical protein
LIAREVIEQATGEPPDPLFLLQMLRSWGYPSARWGRNAVPVSARGGVVKVRVVKDRVFLSGMATTVAKGEVLVGNFPETP